MTRTSQLDAHYAVLQLNALRQQVVMSYRPTIEMLVAEFHEKHDGVPKNSPERVRAKQRRHALFLRLRAVLLEYVSCIHALWGDCGTDVGDLPDADDDVTAEYSRIRAAHETYRREQAGEPLDDDVDEMVDRHHEALVEYATREGGLK